jgi:hypothetical protein
VTLHETVLTVATRETLSSYVVGTAGGVRQPTQIDSEIEVMGDTTRHKFASKERSSSGRLL